MITESSFSRNVSGLLSEFSLNGEVVLPSCYIIWCSFYNYIMF